MKGRNCKVAFSQLRYDIFDSFKKAKWKFVILLSITLLAFIAGIIICANMSSGGNYTIYNFGVINIQNGVIATSFFSRLLSICLVMALLLSCSFTIFTYPLALLISGYRAYLLGVNISLMFMWYGANSIVSSIIAIPCQLCICFVLIYYYILLLQTSCDCKKFGKGGSGRIKTILISFVILLLINIIEWLLLLIFNASVILVI